jgi:hypothetical protein
MALSLSAQVAWSAQCKPHHFRAFRGKADSRVWFSRASFARSFYLDSQDGRPPSEAACIIPFAFAWTYEDAELHPLVLAIQRPFRVEMQRNS